MARSIRIDQPTPLPTALDRSHAIRFQPEPFDDKSAYVPTIDGCDEYAETVFDDVGAFHHRCHFHFLRNREKTPQYMVFLSVRYSDAEKNSGVIR